MDIARTEQYLHRIGITGAVAVDPDSLTALHVAHLRSVPFENLDIVRALPITLDQHSNFHKIVVRRRGGYCYELNGLFADLLASLGFDVRLLSARVAARTGGFGPPFDHLMLSVALADTWLVDVGFGEQFIRPLRLQSGLEQPDRDATWMVLPLEDEWALCRKDEHSWQTVLLFSLAPHALDDFQARCDWTRSSPDSPFRRNPVCTLLTDDGRTTLSGSRLIVTTGGCRHETAVTKFDRHALLLEHFGIALD